MRQNARPILVFDGFKSVISVIKYQEFMPDPSENSRGSDPSDRVAPQQNVQNRA